MKSFAKFLSAAGFLSLAALAAPAASAGVWHLDAASCPDLREDRRDSRYSRGHGDYREDYRDMRVIQCPPRSWTYIADRHEYRHGAHRRSGAYRGTPGVVYTNGYNRFFRMARNGRFVPIDVVVNYRGYGRNDRPHRGHGYGAEFRLQIF